MLFSSFYFEFAHLTETWHNISMFIKQNQFIVEGRDYMTEKKIVSRGIKSTFLSILSSLIMIETELTGGTKHE